MRTNLSPVLVEFHISKRVKIIARGRVLCGVCWCKIELELRGKYLVRPESVGQGPISVGSKFKRSPSPHRSLGDTIGFFFSVFRQEKF